MTQIISGDLLKLRDKKSILFDTFGLFIIFFTYLYYKYDLLWENNVFIKLSFNLFLLYLAELGFQEHVVLLPVSLSYGNPLGFYLFINLLLSLRLVIFQTPSKLR